jgi:hypothetical protein
LKTALKIESLTDSDDGSLPVSAKHHDAGLAAQRRFHNEVNAVVAAFEDFEEPLSG